MACDQKSMDSMPKASNPHLGQMAQGLADSAQTNWENSVAPSLRTGAISAGGYGGSRDAIATGLAAGEAQKGAQNAIANMYGQSYESEQNRALQSQLAQQQADLAREQMKMQGQQFGMGLDWQKQQYGQGLDWQKEQFGKQFGEGQRQFDTGQQNWQDQFGMQNLLAGQQLSNQAAMLPYQQLQILSGLGGQLNAYDQAMMDSDMNNFLRYASVVQPGAGLGASQIATGPAGSKNAGILGGALGGAAMGGQYGGPLGALGGGLLGGFLGGG